MLGTKDRTNYFLKGKLIVSFVSVSPQTSTMTAQNLNFNRIKFFLNLTLKVFDPFCIKNGIRKHSILFWLIGIVPASFGIVMAIFVADKFDVLSFKIFGTFIVFVGKVYITIPTYRRFILVSNSSFFIVSLVFSSNSPLRTFVCFLLNFSALDKSAD